MTQNHVLETLQQLTELVEAALKKGQEIHCSVHLGSYDLPDGEGSSRNRLDGSAAFMVFIDPLPPILHK